MADAVKAQKLAAARKKLKEFQQKTKNVPKKEDSSRTETDQVDQTDTEKQESLTSSTCSSLNGQIAQSLQPSKPAEVQKEAEFQAVQFENEITNSAVPQLSKEEPSKGKNPDLPIYNYFSNAGFDSAYNDRNNFFDNIGDNADNSSLPQKLSHNSNDSTRGLYNTAVYLDNNLYSTPSLFNQNEANADLKICEIYDNLQKNNVTEEESIEINNYLQNERNEFFNTTDNKQDTEMLHEISSWNSNDRPQEDASGDNSEVPQSNVESLLQLSSQIAQLIEPNSDYEVQQPIADLERRNQELAALLERERLKSEQLNAQLQLQIGRNGQLEKETERLRADGERELNAQVAPLKEQLQQHIQTVGVLVAEKTELSAMLKQSQANAKQKLSECEELRARLKTSRSRVADLEREYGREKMFGSGSYEKLQMENKCVKEANEELSQDILELREKLAVGAADNGKLTEEIRAVKTKLDLAEIKIQQLTAGRDMQVDTRIEQLTQEKLLLEKQLSDMDSTLKQTIKERDQANTQFQQHVQQLNVQLSSFASQLDSVTKENDALRSREQSLVAHIGEMEKLMQNAKGNEELQKELDDARRLENDQITVRENFTRVSNERDMLLKDLEAKKESLLELESLVERLRGNRPDASKLLAEIESDKVAAARAVAQNNELKKQLQDIQDDFVKMTDDKLILTEELSNLQHANKELKEKLQHTETQLQMLAEAIEIKDRELTTIREYSEGLNKQLLQHGQLEDRLRHYEAQDNSSQSIQVELQKARITVDNLNAENERLRHELSAGQVRDKVDGNGEAVESIGESRNGRSETLSNEIINKEAAMKQLEEKFLKTMEDIADLTEEKQRLEHIVTQLQGETDTIGEYIALYQHQRGLLMQRAIEKDEQLKQLASDRELMKNKLEQLNSLIKKLVLNKGALTEEILKQHEQLNSQNHLCEEHAKMHQEVNSVAGGSPQEKELGKGDEKQTAEQIIALLSEIKSSNLIQPSDNFHPCPWCSGKLITV